MEIGRFLTLSKSVILKGAVTREHDVLRTEDLRRLCFKFLKIPSGKSTRH